MQHRSLRSIKVREQLQFELLACLPQLRHKVAPADGQPNDMPSTVTWMPCSLYQAALLKGVDHADEIAWIDAQALSQLLLRRTVQVGHNHQRAVVGRAQIPSG